MRSVFLLATNFVRSQWIPVALITVYLAGAGVLFAWHQQAADVQFYLQWHSYNAILVGILIAIPAIWTERRSRRILAVLSKGIARWQYLGGLLLGSAIISAWFCLLIGGFTAWLCARGSIPWQSLPALFLAVFLCSVAGESIGIAFSVILHPLLAFAATLIFLTLPLALTASGRHLPVALFPVSALLQALRDFRFEKETSLGQIIFAAVVQTLFFWGVASALFARKDVTISPE